MLTFAMTTYQHHGSGLQRLIDAYELLDILNKGQCAVLDAESEHNATYTLYDGFARYSTATVVVNKGDAEYRLLETWRNRYPYTIEATA